MDFKDSVKQLSDRVEQLRANLQTEEATKNALIMPFFQALGYDVFNPLEFVPEFTCDIGTKKGEKIDYAIIKDGLPILLVECKHWEKNLTLHDNQLLRYFHVSKAKFGILTNGVIYRFYTDLETPNKMDEKPFLEVDMRDLKEAQIEELKKFHKSYFDIETILSSASELKYTSELKASISKEFSNPTAEFVKYFAKQVYDGTYTTKVAEQFTPLLKRSIGSYINDLISDRLKAAIKEDVEDVEADAPVLDTKEKTIETTVEELEGFYVVKSILRGTIPAERVTYRDAQSYFSVFLDNKNNKPVCRLYLNSATNKQLSYFDDDKKEIKQKIGSLDAIYNYSEQLINAAKKYI